MYMCKVCGSDTHLKCFIINVFVYMFVHLSNKCLKSVRGCM